MNDLTLVCAGKLIPGAQDQIRRYCGLSWSRGEPETWAYEYFDSVPTSKVDDLPGPPDLLAAAALHPGFGRSEASYFNSGGGAEVCQAWLAALPRETDLADADEPVLSQLSELPLITTGVGLSVVSKVAHHKRPRLVPLFDRAIVDWYRPITGLRGEAAWPALIRAMRADLAESSNRRFLADVRTELAGELEGPIPSELRLVDIAIWMHGREG